ncbi:hypothetical protein B0F90DRAFT_1666024 [Multifurca ochricompacta]|uniref:AB hydrolase-1 domain-containing protein n=1 Tax=Multifurca ochricompacta TaxID=376703 RepID=A0AAD4QPP9_9AGAM|nr:hypothetical protein B0F90DRAFT_1666024 [Multifurca ochricompacta]
MGVWGGVWVNGYGSIGNGLMGSLPSRPRRLFGTKVSWPQNPVQLTIQTQADPAKISLRALIETRCSSVLTPFKQLGGFSIIGDFSQVDSVVYDRKLLKLKDGGTLSVIIPNSKMRPTDIFLPAGSILHIQPLLEAYLTKDTCDSGVHGLTGGSNEAYVRNIIAPAIAPLEEGGLGYRAVVVNFRGCAGVPLTSPQLYGLSHTDDFRQAILYIREIYPHAPLLGLGFSLGANILTRYVAEEGESCRLVSACALACPWDAVKTAHALEDHWFYRNVYAKALGTNLKNLVIRHLDSIRRFPDSRFAQALPALLSHSRLSMLQFDSLITLHSGGSSPPFPFQDVWAYYAHASSHDKLTPSEYHSSRSIGRRPDCPSGGAANRWARQPVLEWFKATAEYVSLGPRKHGQSSGEMAGWWKSGGRTSDV